VLSEANLKANCITIPNQVEHGEPPISFYSNISVKKIHLSVWVMKQKRKGFEFTSKPFLLS